jgi:hypothetical protein
LLGAHRQVKRGDARRERGKQGGLAIAHAKDRAGSIADIHRSIPVERQAAGDTQIRRDLLMSA